MCCLMSSPSEQRCESPERLPRTPRKPRRERAAPASPSEGRREACHTYSPPRSRGLKHRRTVESAVEEHKNKMNRNPVKAVETGRRFALSPRLRLSGGAPTFGSPGMLDGLHRLVHDAIISCHHQNDDVGGVGSTGSHGGEGGVARSVEEGDLLTCRQLDWKKRSESGNEASGKSLLSVNEHKPANAAY